VSLLNQGIDSILLSTEQRNDIGEKLSAVDRGNVDTALEQAKKALEGQDLTVINTAYESLTTASHKLSEEIYRRAAEQQQGGSTDSGPTSNGHENGKNSGDDVVDADFEEVRE